jgi:hypothetical protein
MPFVFKSSIQVFENFYTDVHDVHPATATEPAPPAAEASQANLADVDDAAPAPDINESECEIVPLGVYKLDLVWDWSREDACHEAVVQEVSELFELKRLTKRPRSHTGARANNKAGNPVDLSSIDPAMLERIGLLAAQNATNGNFDDANDNDDDAMSENSDGMNDFQQGLLMELSAQLRLNHDGGDDDDIEQLAAGDIRENGDEDVRKHEADIVQSTAANGTQEGLQAATAQVLEQRPELVDFPEQLCEEALLALARDQIQIDVTSGGSSSSTAGQACQGAEPAMPKPLATYVDVAQAKAVVDAWLAEVQTSSAALKSVIASNEANTVGQGRQLSLVYDIAQNAEARTHGPIRS